MYSIPLSTALTSLKSWASENKDLIDFEQIYLFGSAIDDEGRAFHNNSDLDIVIIIPDKFSNAILRTKWTFNLLKIKDKIEIVLLKNLKRSNAEVPIVSIIPATTSEIRSNIHKSGQLEFFSYNRFKNLITDEVVAGINLGEGHRIHDPLAIGCLKFAQNIRHSSLSVSANDTSKLKPYSGELAIPKDIARIAATAAKLLDSSISNFDAFKLENGIELISTTLFELKNKDKMYLDLNAWLKAKISRKSVEELSIEHQLLMAEIIYDIILKESSLKLNSSQNDYQEQMDQKFVSTSQQVTQQFHVNEAMEIEEKHNEFPATLTVASSDKLFPLNGTSSVEFFSERFTKAFPGSRDIKWFTEKRDIDQRLMTLLSGPLKFTNSTPIWWWRGGNLYIYRFGRLEKDLHIMNQEELNIFRIAVIPGVNYKRDFVYIECNEMPPTGVYDIDETTKSRVKSKQGYVTEEFGIFDKKHLMTRSEYDDGGMILEGKLVNTSGNSELRVRYLTPYNFIIAPQGSPINNPRLDNFIESQLNSIISDQNYKNRDFATDVIKNIRLKINEAPIFKDL